MRLKEWTSRLCFKVFGHWPRSVVDERLRAAHAMRKVLVFDADAWREAGGDVGDNSCFWKPATIIETHADDEFGSGEVATVRFDDGRVSYGHCTEAMREIPA